LDLLTVAVAAIPLGINRSASASSRYFIGTVNNNWYNNGTDPTNWNTAANGTGSSGLPVAGDSIFLTATTAYTGTYVTYDYTGPAATFDGISVDSTGYLATETLNMAANTLTTSGDYIVGVNGSGAVNQSGGTTSITGSSSLYLGYNGSSSYGTYLLGGTGQLNVGGDVNVGYNGSSTFTVNGSGLLNVTGNLNVGNGPNTYGAFNLPGGTVNTTVLNVNAGGTFSQTGGTLNAGTINSYTPTSYLNLTDYVLGSAAGSNGTTLNAGGVMTANSITVNPGGSFNEVIAGSLVGPTIASMVDNGGAVYYPDQIYAKYAIASFTLSAGTYTESNTTQPVVIDDGGSFIQTGGTHNVGSGAGSINLFVGYTSGSSTYNLSGSGILNVTGNLNVGNGPNNFGTFNLLPGGTVNTPVLNVNGFGTFIQTGGTLNAGTINSYTSTSSLTLTNYVLGSAAGSNGTTLNAAGGILNANSITVNPGGSFNEGVAGSLIGGRIASLVDNGGAVYYPYQTYSNSTVAAIASFTLSAGTYTESNTTQPVVVDGGGSFIQTGGTHNVGSGAGSINLFVGHISGTSTYNLSGSGILNVTGGLYVGYGGTGSFYQTNASSSVSVAGDLWLGTAAGSGGPGLYQLSGGTITVGGTEIIGNGVTGTFNQSGGTHTVTGLLDVGALLSTGFGAYTLSGVSSQLSAGSMTLGDSGTGVFNQTGGSVTVSGTLLLGNLYTTQNGYANSAVGNYTMNGSGSTLTAGTEIIGNGGATGIGGYGAFVQYNGTNTVTSNFSIGAIVSGYGADFNPYSGDSYDIKGGVLNLPTSTTGAYNYGQFTVDGGTVNGYLNNPQTGTNTLTLNGGNFAGTLNTAAVVNMNAGATFSGTLINVGTFNQNGGTVTGVVQNGGTYNLYAGTFNASNGITTAVNGNGYFYQYGGTIGSATFVNSGTFYYYGGTISGRVINQGLFDVLTTGIVFGNGMENDAYLDFASSAVGVLATFNGQGLDNFGTISLPVGQALAGTIINDYGGSLSGQGTLTGTLNNLGTFTPGNGFTVTGVLTNSGIIGPLSGTNNYASASLLKAAGGLINTGQIQFTGGQITGGTIVNNPGGVIEFSQSGTGTTVSGFSQAVNNSGGVIEIGSGTLVTFASFAAGNTNGGDIQIANNSTFTATTPFPNSGTIELEGSSAALNGGAITNTGSIWGQGRISNTVVNSGTIEASGGKLVISGISSTDGTGSQTIVDSGSTLQYATGLATNNGIISNNGGTFDNNSLALLNTGTINGNGIFKTGGTGLTNGLAASAAGNLPGIIDVTAGTSFYGPVINNYGTIQIYGSTTTFYGMVTENSGGSILVNSGTVYFLGNASIGGLYASDPSNNYFNGLSIASNGNMSGGSMDRFVMIDGRAMNNAGLFADPGTLSANSVTNSGTFTQTGTLIETGNFTNSGAATIGGSQTWSAGTKFTNTAGTATFTSDAGSAAAENLAVNVSGGAVNFSSTQHLASLTVGSGATTQVTDTTTGHPSIVFTPALSVAGKLDLTGNDLDVQHGGSAELASITTLIKQGFNASGGYWNGNGITSSLAATDPTYLTALGVLLNNDGSGHTIFSSSNPFDGTSPALNDVLVKYTYYGDTNLDGAVDGSDYTNIDNGFHNNLTGWVNGDFNYDGVVDGSDYTLIDNAYNMQGASLGSNPAALIASDTEQIMGQIAGTASVPEPAGVGVILMGGTTFLSRRRRSQSRC
jgi:hypothetical protein